MVGRAALDGIQSGDGSLARRIGAEAVNRFGRKGDESAGAQDLRRATDLGGHSLSGAALSTASVCFERKSDSFLLRLGSDKARSATANNAALAAPASPMAKVATGMPFGICTVESSESSPCRCFEGIGTPRTGNVV